MKNILLIVLAVAIGAGPVFAGPALRAVSYRGNYIQNDSNGQTTLAPVAIVRASPVTVVNTQPSVIYTMTINATASNAELDIYDSGNGTTSADPAYEVKCASSGDSRSVEMSAAPLNMYNGISATATNGVGFISFQ